MYKIIVFISILITIACTNRSKVVELKINKIQTLKDIPSASGLEIFEDELYIIGDNSPYLFKLSKDLQHRTLIPLSDTSSAIIAKSVKPDYEALSSYTLNQKTYFLVFGSGSKTPYRDSLLIIDAQEPKNIKKYSLRNFYQDLIKQSGGDKADFNLEAAATNDKHLFLFNRGNNLIFKSDFQEFLSTLSNFKSIKSETLKFEMPEIDGTKAGFSGASITPDKKYIVFTASVENTKNWIDDGEVLGSFIGLIRVKDQKLLYTLPVIQNGKHLKLKVESIAVESQNDSSLNLLVVTDSDGGYSELVSINLNNYLSY